MLDSYSKSIANLIEEFERFPSIGHKTAVRMAFHVLNMTKEEAQKFSETIINAKENLKFCKYCYNISDNDPCNICQDVRRDKSVICVVEDVKDIIAMERTHEYKGLYHVLQGVISPMNGVGPNDIKIKELLERLKDNVVKAKLIKELCRE